MEKTDTQLIEDYLNGDKNVFDEIVNRYLKTVYNFVYRLVGNTKEAEDITQEVFLKVWKNLKKFDREKSFKTWIFSIAKNTAIDFLRKRKDIPISFFDNDDEENFLENTLIDEEPLADKVIELEYNKKEIEKVMLDLTVVQREVIILKYLNEMSLSEVSEIMNIPKETVKSHHRRALIKMKKKLESSAPKLSK